jgi:kinesin family protein 3/17
MKQFAKERQIIDAKVEIAEEDRKKLLEELEQKQINAQQEKSNAQKLLTRIKKMQEKLLQGDEAMEKAMK